MKKIVLAGVVTAAFVSASAMADITVSATASWDASATKDTTSALVVTPLKSLTFQYAEGIKAFNTQIGASVSKRIKENSDDNSRYRSDDSAANGFISYDTKYNAGTLSATRSSDHSANYSLSSQGSLAWTQKSVYAG